MKNMVISKGRKRARVPDALIAYLANSGGGDLA